jgi:hypothetical protein
MALVLKTSDVKASVGSNPTLSVEFFSFKIMKINLWYCKNMKQWRWTLTDNSCNKLIQESGQRPDLRIAMNDIANTVEYLMHRGN